MNNEENLKIEVLISTINQKDNSLLDKMNIQSDAVVVNQADVNKVEVFYYKGNRIKWISMTERGIGLSRNTALMNSSADIVLFADDDMRYVDRYYENVIKEFQYNDRADVVCFNINLINSTKNIGGHRNNLKNKRLHFFNSMRYGACLIAARRKTLLRERISFSLLFGGGTEFGSGEDSIFIKDCLDSGLKLYSNIYVLGDVDDSSSSWYNGISEKFFIDRGIALASAFPAIHPLLYLYYAKKQSRLDTEFGYFKICQLFFKGRKTLKRYR